MPNGSINYTPQPPPVASAAVPIYVCLYTPPSPDDDDDVQPYALLANIRCESIQYKEGADPPAARFSYILDEVAGNQNGWPTDFSEIWPLASTVPSPYVVGTDDHIVVLAALPDGTTRVLFHGFARVPQTDVDPSSQSVTFTATGVAVRCWDTPIHTRPQRDGSDPCGGAVYLIDAPWRFNPAGDSPSSVGGIIPNCTPDMADVGESGPTPYPVFAEPVVNTNASNVPGCAGGGDYYGDHDGNPVLWDLSRAARTILAVYNPASDAAGVPAFVQNPIFDDLESLLQNRKPLQGATTYDPDDPSTYTIDDNILRDVDVTNKPWPDALSELFEHYGFAMRWTTGDNADGTPLDALEVYRKDSGTNVAPKQVYLPQGGTSIVGALANLASFHAGWDFHGVANEIHLDTAYRRYEVSYILAPMFKPASGDGMGAANSQFLAANLDTAAVGVRDKYRVWGIDELGEGTFRYDDPSSPGWVTMQPFDFSRIFPPANDGTRSYVQRRRKAAGTLLSKDALGKPYKAQLAISRNYGNTVLYNDALDYSPCTWVKPAAITTADVWQVVNPGTWNLLPDRVGIRIICEDVEKWNVGKPPNGAPTALNGSTRAYWPVSTGVLRGITAMCDPTGTPGLAPPGKTWTTEPYWLRLTIVLDGDVDLRVRATRRASSPLSSTTIRRVDCKDHYGYEAVSIYSPFNDPAGAVNPPAPIVTRDDRTNATAYAAQMRSAHEFPPLAASITIPSLDLSYKVGDRIDAISGLNASFQTNAGTSAGEAKEFPYVVATTFSFEGERQSVSIQLSDRRHEPAQPRG